MKIIHVLFLCTAVSIAALSALVLMAAGIIYSRDFYYTHDSSTIHLVAIAGKLDRMAMY